MKKLEMVYDLQKTIEQLNHETDSFEIHIKEMLALIAAKKLLPELKLQKMAEQLETIYKLGQVCREEYCQLETVEEAPEYIEQICVTLTATERLLKKRETYLTAKEEFLQLYSNKEEVEEQLAIYQKELTGYVIENMTEEEVKTYVEKYVIFMKAWREREALQLVDYVQKLLETFSKELVVAAVFQKEELFLKDIKENEKINLEGKIKGQEIRNDILKGEIQKEFLEEEIEKKFLEEETEKNAIEGDIQKKILKEKILQKTQEEITKKVQKENIKSEELKEVQQRDFKQETAEKEKQEQEKWKPEELQKRELREEEFEQNFEQEEWKQEKVKNKKFPSKKYKVEVESCLKKEKKKFGVKIFRNDISGFNEGVRKRILRGIRQYGGVTAELVSAMTEKTKEEARQECEALLNNGYLRKYMIKDMGEIYFVSPKGKKIFEVLEARNFLNIKEKLLEWQTFEEMENMESAVVTRLMSAKALSGEFRRRILKDVIIEQKFKESFFFLKCRNLDEEDWRYYTGASEWIQDEEEYISCLKAFIGEERKEEDTEGGAEKLIKKIIVFGEENSKDMLKKLISRSYKEKVDSDFVVYYKYDKDLVIEEEGKQEKEAAATEETEKAEEIGIKVEIQKKANIKTADEETKNTEEKTDRKGMIDTEKKTDRKKTEDTKKELDKGKKVDIEEKIENIKKKSDKRKRVDTEEKTENTKKESDKGKEIDIEEETDRKKTIETKEKINGKKITDIKEVSDKKTTEKEEVNKEEKENGVKEKIFFPYRSVKEQKTGKKEIENKEITTQEEKESEIKKLENQFFSIKEEKSETSFEEEQKQKIVRNYQNMIEQDKIYCATAYLHAAAQQNKELLRLYYKVAYAVNDPLADCIYSSNQIFDLYFDNDDSVLSEYYMVSALLRNYFMDHAGYDYQMQQLYDGVKECGIITKDHSLGEVIYGLLEFKEQAHSGMDRFADYKRKDMVVWESKIVGVKNEAKGYYENYVLGKTTEQASHKRFVETKKLVFSQEGEFAFYLKVVAEDTREHLQKTKNYLQNNFMKEGDRIDSENLDADKINYFLDDKWEKAAQHLRIAKKSSDLMSSLRMNLYNQVKKALSSICDWVNLLEHKVMDETEKGFELYKKVRDGFIENIQKAIQSISVKTGTKDLAGRKVVLYTLFELKARLEGTYQSKQEKYFYISFLANDKVLLNEKYYPDAEMEVFSLPEFALTKRIELHAKEKEQDFSLQMRQILDGEDDYGSAMLLEHYFADCKEEQKKEYNIAEAILYAEKSARMKREEFVENLELAESYGQMGDFSEDKKEKILQAVNGCYTYAYRTKNFGYFSKVLQAFQLKIKEEARCREYAILKEMEGYLDSHREISQKEDVLERVEKIYKMLKAQNYTVAEDLLNRLINHEEESELELLEKDYLEDFLRSYDYNYANVSDTGKKLYTLLMTTRAQKEIKGGKKLLEAWLSNGGNLGEQKLMILLTMLGFPVEQTKSMPKLSNKIENYYITLKQPENGKKLNYKHPIAAFGSIAMKEGFRVVCLYGKYDASSLIDTFKEIGNAKHTIVLLDYPLSDSERRKLARKTKLEISEKIFGVIDRVMLVYLVNNYTETAINRMLMAVMMPYTYYQPYVVESANPMPPEIFIGRKEELSKIESPAGVNLVYGGRQLGKSTLLRMAKNDIDQNENGDRAVLVNIKDLDYKKAARKVSQALADEGILQQEFETDDWDNLARELKRRLQSNTEEKIPYLLLLFDEADIFIESSEVVNYHPFDSLKDVQEVGAERFKFVVAGLHNIIRFKKNSALGNNSVLTHMESLTVTPFRVMEAKELLQIPLFYLGFRFPKEKDSLVSMILAATNYFPGLLQLYCAKLLEAMKRDYAGYNEKSTPPYEIQENHIKKVLSEEGFQQKIREKFMVTLKLDEDNTYYMVALLTAYINYEENNNNGCSPNEILDYAKKLELKKVKEMQPEQIEALMEEMRELNVLRLTAENRYWFTRNNFFQMMGTKNQIEEEIMKYM